MHTCHRCYVFSQGSVLKVAQTKKRTVLEIRVEFYINGIPYLIYIRTSDYDF
jgi:hypothetical protein